MHEDYHEYLTRVIAKARHGSLLRNPHSEEDLAFMLLDSMFQYGFTPIKDIESRSGEKFNYSRLLKHLVDFDSTNVNRFFKSGEVYFHSGAAYNLFPSIFSRLMIQEPKSLAAILDMAGGREFLDLIGYDVSNGFSLSLLKKQTPVEIQDGLEIIFRFRDQSDRFEDPTPPIEDFSYSQFIVANSILLAQKFIEDSHSVFEVFEVFKQRNSWMLMAFGMEEGMAKHYGRFLACSSLFPYDPSGWPEGVKFADLLGFADERLKHIPNYRGHFNWQHSPLQGVLGKLLSQSEMQCEDRFNFSPLFRRYYEGLRGEHLEDKHFMTLGMDSLLNQFRADDLSDYAERSTRILIKVIGDDPDFNLYEAYINDVIGAQSPAAVDLIKLCFERFSESVSVDDLAYLLECLHEKAGTELFDQAARDFVLSSSNGDVIKHILPLMSSVEGLSSEVNTSTRRLLIEHELSL